MNATTFQNQLQRLQEQVAVAERLRREFDTFKQQVPAYASATKQSINAFFQEARNRFDKDVKQIQRDKQFCENIFNNDRAVLEQGFAERSKGIPCLAKAFGDYLALRDDQIAYWLKSKSHPAYRAADVVKEMKAERRALEEKCKVLEYTLLYYEELFPALADYREADNSSNPTTQPDDSDDDPAKNWLSPEEYSQLPDIEKNQRALDNYWKRPKSPWRLGRDYERFVGFQYEKKGYQVVYQGIIKGLEDCGRDLICTKDGTTEIVQCKYWAQNKLIREKHINQLFGTCVEYWISHSKHSPSSQMDLFPTLLVSNNIIPCFVTSTVLSDTARAFARALNIRVIEKSPLKPYPCIKCNISRSSGERIYHLPFDQQYDTTVIESNRGEFYAETVQEAESRGYRRAFRWQGDRQ